MEDDKQGVKDQGDAAPGNDEAEAARPGRPPHHVGRRRFLASGLAAGPVLLTLGSARASAAFPVGTACHSNSLSKLASFHPGTTRCPDGTTRPSN